MPRAKQRTPALRQRILDAALARLDAGGVGAVTARGVAAAAGTSVPAVYELFGSKQGLVRALFFSGFSRLGAAFEDCPRDQGPRLELEALAWAFRDFARAHPALVGLIFGRAFESFDPGPEDQAAGGAVRTHVVSRMRRGVETGVFAGDPTDIAHGFVALLQGLALQEGAGWLGADETARERRWRLAVTVFLDGLGPGLVGATPDRG